jgi:predicted DNA-binding transcriptional regulator AlpA
MSPPDLDRLLDEKEAAQLLSLSPSTVRGWRSRGEGPQFVRFERAIRYRRTDLLKYAAEHVTTEPGEAHNPAGLGGRPKRRRRRS